MFKKIVGKWLKRGVNSEVFKTTSSASRMEGLEGRVLMAADGPRVLSIVADNRGLVNFQFDRTVEQTTLNTGDIKILTAGKDKKLGTADDVLQPISGTIYNTAMGANTGLQIGAVLPANTTYRIVLVSGGITGGNKKALDGESVGSGALPSGDGVAGGNLDVIVTPTKKLTARVSTSNGPIDVTLYNKSTPKSVTNFLNYANSGAYDTTFFHRLVPGFVLQGGGYDIITNAKRHRVSIGQIPILPGKVLNEPGISNTVGTIAFAKKGPPASPSNPDPVNSATDEFFFNLADNSQNLNAQNGGFTVFGTVANSASLSVMQSLGQAGTKNGVDPHLKIYNQAVIFDDFPMIDTSKYTARNNVLDPSADPVRIFRVAVLEGIAATPGSKVLKAKAAVVAPAVERMSAGAVRAAVSVGGVFADGAPILHSDGSVLD